MLLAREDHELILVEPCGSIEYFLPLHSRQFVRMAAGLCVRSAVFSGQVIGLRDLPDEDQRPLSVSSSPASHWT